MTDTLEHFLEPSFEDSRFKDVAPTDTAEWEGLGGGAVVCLLGIAVAWLVYLRRRELPGRLRERFAALHAFLSNKWYFDELFDRLFVQPTLALGRFGRGVVETDFVQGTIVGGATGIVRAGSSFARAIQTGYLRAYAMLLLIGVGALALYFLIASS